MQDILTGREDRGADQKCHLLLFQRKAIWRMMSMKERIDFWINLDSDLEKTRLLGLLHDR